MTIYLYVKTHSVTGLKYFGKTIKEDVHGYSGSGVYWKRHLKAHGGNYTTEIVGAFEDQQEATEFALDFSRKNNIVKSDVWANLKEEDAVDGGGKGIIISSETKQKISEAKRGRTMSDEFKAKMSKANKGRPVSNETRRKLSEANRGKTMPEEMKQKMSAIRKNLRWITDGNRNRLIDKLEALPDGWRYGRLPAPVGFKPTSLA